MLLCIPSVPSLCFFFGVGVALLLLLLFAGERAVGTGLGNPPFGRVGVSLLGVTTRSVVGRCGILPLGEDFGVLWDFLINNPKLVNTDKRTQYHAWRGHWGILWTSSAGGGLGRTGKNVCRGQPLFVLHRHRGVAKRKRSQKFLESLQKKNHLLSPVTERWKDAPRPFARKCLPYVQAFLPTSVLFF